MKIANAEVERLTNHLNSEQVMYTKSEHYKNEQRRELRHQKERAATAEERVDHYGEKIRKKTVQIKP